MPAPRSSKRWAEQLFFDPSLSASGRMSCATCHDPQHAFGPPNALAVQLGGKDMLQPGVRAVPSLEYLQVVPPFTEHYFESDDEGDDSIDNGPTGGLTWDGRVDRGRDQARIPLLSPFEMANGSPADVVARCATADMPARCASCSATTFLPIPRRPLPASPRRSKSFSRIIAHFYPYSSKYDAFLAGRATLTPQEARGLALFDDPDKGNCGNCHRSERGNDGTPPQFTDYGMIARRRAAQPRRYPANADPAYFDLGLCGPLRTDLCRARTNIAAASLRRRLRNVALRQSFFHNGVLHSLREAIAFYVERDTDPAKWYPRDADRPRAKIRRSAGGLSGQRQYASRRSAAARRCAARLSAARSTTSSRSLTR